MPTESPHPAEERLTRAAQVAVCLRFLWGVLLDDPLGVLRPGTSTLMTWVMPHGSTVDTAAVAAGQDDVLADAEQISAGACARTRRR